METGGDCEFGSIRLCHDYPAVRIAEIPQLAAIYDNSEFFVYFPDSGFARVLRIPTEFTLWNAPGLQVLSAVRMDQKHMGLITSTLI